MQTSEPSRDTLRRLAEFKPARGKVWSLYLNLDPAQFATAQARASEAQSVIDEARRRLKHADGLAHDEKVALREDLESADAYLKDGLDARGAHGVALFVSGPARYFEALKLSTPVRSQVVIGDSPYIEPLAGLTSHARWAVLLVNRRTGRLLTGSRARLEEVEDFRRGARGGEDESAGVESRDQHAVEAEARDHFKQTADLAFRHLKLEPFDRLLLGCQAEICGEVEAKLHSYLRDRLAGRFDVDVENATPDVVRDAALELMDADERRREREALDRMAEGLGARGRAAAGLDEVLAKLVERRVDTLLVDEGFGAAGVACPRCGWVGSNERRCPGDGGPLERKDDIVETAVQMALTQSAEVVVVRHHVDLRGRGGIGAVLRF
jgi:peptide subunit release factor 1 (eRF1)